MKTYSRIVLALLILMALLLAMSVSAQEKPKVTTVKPRPSVVLDTQVTRATPTPTPSPTPKLGLRIPSKISMGTSLPEIFRDQQRRETQQPKMPNVIGQQFQTAESMVRERQPNARISSTPSSRYNPDYRPGAVIYQSLKEGTDLQPGVEITLVYNPAQSRVNYPKMPNVIGQHFQTAESMVRERQPRTRISSTPSPRFNPDFRPFAVFSQSLKEGTDLQPGVEVTLVYNPQQPAPTYPRMPDLVGMDIRAAQARLSGEAPNYPQRSIEEREFNPRFNPGVVVNQSPRAGMALQPRGVAVMYYNPQPPKVTVPDVMGLTVPEAVRRIEQNNLVARLPRRGTLDSYKITGQSPPAGTLVDARSAVTLTVAATVVVPDLRRSLLNEAQQTITQNKLMVGSVTTRISPARQDEVLSQSPAPNSIVVEGTAVNLVIARTEQVPVPQVLNQQLGNAEQLIANARLVVGQVTKRESPRAAGTVLDQSPRAGTMVNVGSQVSLVIAMPETVVVPDLQNKAQGTAEQLITNARLAIGQVTTQQTTVVAGTVLSQIPSAGTLVNVGTQVSFVVAVPSPTASPTPSPTPISPATANRTCSSPAMVRTHEVRPIAIRPLAWASSLPVASSSALTPLVVSA